MIKYSLIRNVFVVGGLIVIIYLVFLFASGGYVQHQLDGTWISVCGTSDFMFTGNEYTHNRRTGGTFRVRGNRILFCSGSSYTISVRRLYMVMDGRYYLRRD